MLKFKRQLVELKIGHYKGGGKFHIEKTQQVMGHVYGDTPLFGYCRVVAPEPGHADDKWSIIHIPTGFTMLYCSSEKRCRFIIKEIEKSYRYIFEFDTVPDSEYFKPHKPAIVYLRTLAQGGD